VFSTRKRTTLHTVDGADKWIESVLPPQRTDEPTPLSFKADSVKCIKVSIVVYEMFGLLSTEKIVFVATFASTFACV